MKRFTEYLNEDFDPAIYNSDGGISIEDPTVVDAINSNLEVATACSYRTPYNSLEEIRKVLAYYKIFLPKSIFLDQTDGNDVFEISQFGEKTGMNNQGEVVTANDSSLFVYFEWSVNERGMFDTFACICNQEELDDILADFDSETGDDINEQAMPDLKKKMGAKKVTLPNMMRKEETKDSLSGGLKRTDLGLSDKLNKKGKLSRKTQKWMKTLAHGSGTLYSRSLGKPKGHLPEETINEIADTKKGKIVLKKVIDKAFKKYYDAYDSETDARAEVQKKRTPESREAASDARAVKIKAKDRVVKFQQYADKKKLKENKDVPWDTKEGDDKPSTPYTNPRAKAKQLARAAAKKAKPKKLDELKGTSTRGKLARYALDATHQLHHSDPYTFDRTGKQSKNITKRMKGMALAGRKLDRMNKDA